MKKILFLSVALSLILSISFAQDIAKKEGSKITEYGINKNQPISAGDYIYKSNLEPVLGHHSVTDYFYDGIENNSIKIKTYTYQPLGVLSLSLHPRQKKLTPQQAIDRGHPILSSFSLPLNSVNQAILNVATGEPKAGCRSLLINVVPDSKILVNEIEVKPVPGIKYDNKDREKLRTIYVNKPVIYLYPAKEQKVSVRLEYQGDIIASYPKYDNDLKGWKVIAYPGGRIVNLSDDKEYSYLFWEGLPAMPVRYDFSKGFVVKGEDMASFLQKTLALIGLNPREYNEFIVYWLPRMQNNKYNLIHFVTKEYEEAAKLDITPKPDAILRVFMAFKPLNDKINIEPQEIKPFKREGFTVVEWGGTELK